MLENMKNMENYKNVIQIKNLLDFFCWGGGGATFFPLEIAC